MAFQNLLFPLPFILTYRGLGSRGRENQMINRIKSTPPRPWVRITLVAMMTLLASMFVNRSEALNVPKEAEGWRAKADVPTYDRQTLFDYINGGAELYLAYRFQKLYAYTFKKAGGPDIILDIYEMETPRDAFGVFTAEREGDDIGIGDGSEYEAGLLRMHRGKYFISIVTYDEKPESKSAVHAIARSLAATIPAVGEKPDVISTLPADGLIRNSIRYFYRHTILNLHYFVAEENVLHLGNDTEAVFATYRIEEGRPYLLVVKYPSAAGASTAHGDFKKAYMPDANAAGFVQTEDKTWAGVKTRGRYLAIVFDAKNQKDARALLDRVQIE
jgi:hypothetical protein